MPPGPKIYNGENTHGSLTYIWVLTELWVFSSPISISITKIHHLFQGKLLFFLSFDVMKKLI